MTLQDDSTDEIKSNQAEKESSQNLQSENDVISENNDNDGSKVQTRENDEVIRRSSVKFVEEAEESNQIDKKAEVLKFHDDSHEGANSDEKHWPEEVQEAKEKARRRGELLHNLFDKLEKRVQKPNNGVLRVEQKEDQVLESRYG